MTFHLKISRIGVSCAAAFMVINSLLIQSSAQIITGPTSSGNSVQAKEIFRVLITLFGVDNQTGNVLSFVKVNDVTNARFFNATKDDSIDKDGIIETLISFPNETVSAGANFTACEVILKDLTMSCKWGLNVPGRTAAIQIIPSTYKQNVG